MQEPVRRRTTDSEVGNPFSLQSNFFVFLCFASPVTLSAICSCAGLLFAVLLGTWMSFGSNRPRHRLFLGFGCALVAIYLVVVLARKWEGYLGGEELAFQQPAVRTAAPDQNCRQPLRFESNLRM